jgi:hypothetical protein
MTTKLHVPAIPFATAFNLPLDSAIERLNATAVELTVAAEKTSRSQGFGSRLADAVKRKQSSHAVFAEAPCKNYDDDNDDDEKNSDKDNESFGKK